MASGVPVWVKPAQLHELEIVLQRVLDLGGRGLWLDQQLFAEEDISKILEKINGQLHILQVDG